METRTTGPTPRRGYVIRRSFRGQTLYLTHFDLRLGNDFRWQADSDRARIFTDPGEAISLCETASREYGAACAVISPDGSAIVPGHRFASRSDERRFLAQKGDQP